MANEQDWKNLGEQILDSVAGALNTGDFRQLNNLVSGTVNNVVQEAKKQADFERMSREARLNQYRQNNAANYERWRQQQAEIYRRREERREEWRQTRQAQMDARMNQVSSGQAGGAVYGGMQGMVNGRNYAAAVNRPPRAKGVKFNQVGNVSSVVNTVFGVLGLGIGMALVLMTLVVGLTNGLPIGFFAIFTLLFSISRMKKGSKQRKLLERARRYIQICGMKMYADVAEIAAKTGQSVSFVRKDIKKMLRAGMFPEGHLDEQESCLMLSNEVYHQYTQTSEAFKMREQMELERSGGASQILTAAEQEAELRRKEENELNAMMAEGMGYVRKLRELNDAIPGEEITTQLCQLESLLKQIFDRVREHPEQRNRMQKLMEYYLPTTVKLVEAYVQFEKVEAPGQNIREAKAEIQKTLGIINEAFSELLNNLFQDEVFDATTDAQVLQTMLSREGLRREMSMQPVAAQVQEEEEETITLTMEPEQPEVLSALKAPWES